MSSLHSQVHSFSQSEKRFFARFSALQSTDASTQYLRLFRAIAAQRLYDEEALRKKFGAKLFPQLKQQLQRKLHQAIHIYHLQLQDEHQLRSKVMVARILGEKGMRKEALKLLEKVKLRAREEQWPELELEILREQNSIYTEGASRIEVVEQLTGFHARSVALMTLMETEVKYEELLLVASMLKEELEGARNREEEVKIRLLLAHPLLRKKARGLQVYPQMIYSYVNSLCYYLLGSYEKSFSYLADVKNEALPVMKRYSALQVKLLSNKALLRIRLGEMEKAKQDVQQLQELAGVQKKKVNYLVYLLGLMMYTASGAYGKAIAHIEQNEEWTEAYETGASFSSLSQEKVYRFFATVAAYYGNGNLRKAGKLLQEFIRSEADHVKRDAYVIARILNLAIHFELSNETLIESELRSVQRLLGNEKKRYRFETVFLQFINRMQVVNSDKARRNSFAELHRELKKLEGIPFEKNAFLYFDFVKWAADRC